MNPGEVDGFLRTLEGVKRKGSASHPAWYVHDRLVARLVDDGELLVRAAFGTRERLVASAPETFGVPPRYEKHQKVQVRLDGDPAAIRAALTAAWQMQR